ncbi:hypothetical protein KAT80_02590 [Candidatus Pacearchaeota archaeon]|nr:hypothetical protein [Candidatus Pacearchaeota archaeon]
MVKSKYSVKVTGDKIEKSAYPALYFSRSLDLLVSDIRKLGGTKRERFNKKSNRYEETYTLNLNGQFVEAEIYFIELSHELIEPFRVNFHGKTKSCINKILSAFKNRIEFNGINL